jgi:hypothetical protein
MTLTVRRVLAAVRGAGAAIFVPLSDSGEDELQPRQRVADCCRSV